MLPGPFEELVGRDGVRQAPDDRLDGIPIAFEVSPGTAEEVAACLRVAAEQRAAVVASGGGSKLAWGNPPDAKEVVRLSLARLDRTFSIEAEEGIGIVGAGVRLDRLREATAALGRRSLLDTRHEGATVGGTVATEAFGASLGPENRLRGELLGIQVALPNGTLARRS
jgi:glycolate oxidase FAD binding subunit